MSKKDLDNKTSSEKIFEKLTGQVGVDKELLINSMHKLRGDNAPTEEVMRLGVKLYQILLENGLNESDVINPVRLMSKVEAFMYDGKLEKALEILEVLDSLEYYQKHPDKSVCYVSSRLEAEIAFLYHPEIKKEEAYVLSNRQVYLNIKTQIYLEMGKTAEAIKTNQEVLSLNPANFDALSLKAELLKGKNLEKFRTAVKQCGKVAFEKRHMIEYYRLMAEYFEKKGNFYGAYITLLNILQYEDQSLISGELHRLEVEMNKTALNRFHMPTDAEIKTFCKNEKVATAVPEANLLTIASVYQDELIIDEDDEELAYIKQVLLDLSQGNDFFVKDLQKRAKTFKVGKTPKK